MSTKPDNEKRQDDSPDAAATAVLDDIESLRSRAQERDQFLSLLQRTQADFENYQKRNSRERDQERRYAHAGLAMGLLPVLDNLERALAAAKQAGENGRSRVFLINHGCWFVVVNLHPIDALQAFDPICTSVMRQAQRSAVKYGCTSSGTGFYDYDRRCAGRVVVSIHTEDNNRLNGAIQRSPNRAREIYANVRVPLRCCIQF